MHGAFFSFVFSLDRTGASWDILAACYCYWFLGSPYEMQSITNIQQRKRKRNEFNANTNANANPNGEWWMQTWQKYPSLGNQDPDRDSISCWYPFGILFKWRSIMFQGFKGFSAFSIPFHNPFSQPFSYNVAIQQHEHEISVWTNTLSMLDVGPFVHSFELLLHICRCCIDFFLHYDQMQPG